MNEYETKTQEIEEKIAQKSGKSIEDVRKGYDRIIKTSDVNKDGEELYILRKITSKEFHKGYYKNKCRYSIYTLEGQYSGFIDVTISNSNKAEIEYKSVPKQRNKGNITISLEEVLADIFIDNSFDNLTVRDIFPKTKIREVFLAINSDNYASQAVANKIGFQQNGTIYIMTREQFLQRTQEKKIAEQEIERTTADIKTQENEFKIPEKKIQMLNEFIQKNLYNRRNSTDYNLLDKISGMITRNLKVTNRNFGEITSPSTEEQTKKVALEFFKGLDKDLYERAKNIIEGNSDIDFNMYKLDKNDDFSMQKYDGMPVHTKTPCVISKNGKSAVYVPCKGTVEDIYLLVHELSHTFDLIPNDNPTRNLLGEVIPYCFEAMLSQYLVEKSIATREDVINREKGNIVSQYDDGVETFAKLELMKMKEQKGDIKQEDLTAMQKKYGLTTRQLGYVLGRLGRSEPNVDYRARYMIARVSLSALYGTIQAKSKYCN